MAATLPNKSLTGKLYFVKVLLLFFPLGNSNIVVVVVVGGITKQLRAQRSVDRTNNESFPCINWSPIQFLPHSLSFCEGYLNFCSTFPSIKFPLKLLSGRNFRAFPAQLGCTILFGEMLQKRPSIFRFGAVGKKRVGQTSDLFISACL